MRYFTAIFMVSAILLYSPMAALLAVPAIRQAGQQAREAQGELLDRTYLQLFRMAEETRVSKAWIENRRESLEEEKDREKKRLKEQKKSIEDSIDRAQDQLDELNENPQETPQSADQRHVLHCKIQKLRKELHDVELILEQGLETRYDNLNAKLRILEEWPAEQAEIQKEIASGEVTERKFADYRDGGFRDGEFEGQQDDIKQGREAVQELKRQDLLPPEITDEQVSDYIKSLAQRIARHSDLRVPIKVQLLKSEEINAFALPGGFLFLNTGLVLKAEKESELAGVIAHEIGHVTARHGHRLMNKAQIAGIIFQAAQIAALVLTGGVSSIGTYYALQYGFLGLGMVLNLSLLGVSRDFEQEADILGTQYLWDAGYDTSGFVSFFGRMAEEKGYITGLSWFRTHPPFYKRMSVTFREMTILPETENPIVDRAEFHQMKERLTGLLEQMKDQDEDAPTLKRVYDCEDIEVMGDVEMGDSGC